MLWALIIVAATMACDGLLPKNDLQIPVEVTDGLTESQFNIAINRVLKFYSPIIKKNGVILKVNRSWRSTTVNASTTESKDGKLWTITIYGGFARHRFTTMDGLSAVICHELGHHIGGAPKKMKTSWSSTEGQADYFSALKCLRNIFGSDDNAQIMSKIYIPERVRQKCRENFQNSNLQALCHRTTLAGLSIARVGADSRGWPLPDFDFFDETVVEKTYDHHPSHQCRLDTYFSASLCKVDPDREVSNQSEIPGTCYTEREFTDGVRPFCWYRPARIAKKKGRNKRPSFFIRE